MNRTKRLLISMLTLLCCCTGTWALDQEGGYYLIGSVQDWTDFATLVQTTPTANAKMTEDIDLGDDQTMVGTYAVKYQGTFDGQGHTLTINYNTSSMTIESGQSYLGAAPFRDIQNATIRNLHTAGTVTADKIGATGLVGWTYGTNTIERCWSSVDIVSSNNTVDTFAGFVFRQDGSLLTMNDCYYSGKIQSGRKWSHAGFVGHHTTGTVVLNNCLVIFADGTDVPASTNSGNKCYTFVRDQDQGKIITLNNCYYKTAFGTVQGTQATTEQLSDGTVAYKLQASRADMFWGQRIGTDLEPVLTNDESYRVYKSKNGGYTNDPTEAYPGLQQDADGNYLIDSVQDWQDFADLIRTAPTANAKMTADIDLGDDQTMVGTENNKYQGTFDGQGHKLTIAYNVTENNAAPFRFVSGANIRNLHVDGTINTTQQFAGGVVARAVTSVTSISNCWSSVNIIGTYNEGSGGDTDFHGGLVAIAINASTTIDLIHLNDCLFTGSIKGGDATRSHCANFIGLQEYANSTITNCLSTATYTDQKQYNASYHWFYGGGTISNALFLNANYTSGNGGRGTQITTEQLANGTTTATLNAGRTGDDALWVQDLITNQPMLKTFASLWQDADGTYCISTDAGWTAFANGINDGKIAAATNVKLMADVTATTMIGNFSGNFNSSKVYSGTFDGNHHTITANINNSSTNYVALISSIRNATIKDLTITGSISGGQHCSGLVSVADGTNTISNVSISATITGSNSHCAGVLGHSYSSVTTINDCIFTGTINGRSGGSTIGVFNGWSGSTGVSINNCVEAGTYTNNSTFNPIAISGLTSYSNNYFVTPAKNSNYVYGTQMSTSIPDNDVYGQLTVAGNTYYIPTVVSGINNIYELIDDPITPEPTVTYIGNSLIEGTDYTVSYSNNDAVGTATVTITGAGEFSGEKNINFIIYSSDYALIGTAEQLRNFAALVNGGVTNANGKLIADIDLAGDDDNQWTPIGTETNKYNGTFDGQGFTIKNLYYKQQAQGVGLFGFASNSAYIRNVRVEGTVDNSTDGAGAGNGGTQTCAGGIIGKSDGATVLNCSFSGNVISYSNVGGLVGWGTATIVNCYNEGTVTFHSTANQTGGGVHGYNGLPQLKNCYNVGSVINNGSGSYAIGSLSVSGSVSNSYSRSGCVQNGTGASWINAGNTGTVMSLEDMKTETFVTTLNTNVASLRATYPDISEWVQDPVTNLPMLAIFANTVTLADGDDLSALSAFAGKTCKVAYSRTFTEGKSSTVCLPFAYTKKEGDGSFYAFMNIEKVNGEYVATMAESESTTLTANTPYLYTPNSNSPIDFSGTYILPDDISASSTTNNGWTFKGTYQTKEWTTAPTGVYGFSAQAVSEQGISQGQFVKVGAYVRIKPMRCYLEYTGSDSQWAGARGMTRAADEPLPETIKVRLISADGDVTAIGSLSTVTGEVTFDKDAWYSLDGRRIEGKPTVKGIYVNNGKKIVVK